MSHVFHCTLIRKTGRNRLFRRLLQATIKLYLDLLNIADLVLYTNIVHNYQLIQPNPIIPAGESSKSYMCIDSPPPSGFDSSSNQNGGASVSSRRISVNYMMEESLPPSPPPPQSNMVLRKRIHRIKQGMKKWVYCFCKDWCNRKSL